MLALWAAAGCSPAAPPLATAAVPSPTATGTVLPSPVLATASPLPATSTSTPAPSATALPPTATVKPSATPTSTEAAATATPTSVPATAAPATQSSSGSFTPNAASVWNTVIVGSDNLSGSCSGPLTPVYGLVQVTPNGDTLTWKSQEPAPYTLSPAGPNTWQYSGPTAVGDGTLTLVVKFTSATTLAMTRTFVPSAEPGCTHMHNYSGTFQWFS